MPLDPLFVAQRLENTALYLAFNFDHPLLAARALVLLDREQQLFPEMSALKPMVEGLLDLRRADDAGALYAFERGLRLSPKRTGHLGDLYFRRFLRWQPPWLLVRSHPEISLAPILEDLLSPSRLEPLERGEADRVYVLNGSTLNDVTIMPTPPRPSRFAP